MKDRPVSNCERDFVKNAIESKLRLDGRDVYEMRQLEITFGLDRGCCLTHLGDTVVFCQVSCEIEEPKLMRPNEGNLYIHVELSPGSSPAFIDKRNTELVVTLNRVLEKTIKESKAVDLESLCIIGGEKVWSIRVDVQVLNHEGNILDCACVAAVAALAHFRRPEVTVDDGMITVHPARERDPAPLSVLHYPFTVSLAFFCDGQYLAVDPGLLEERVADGCLVAALNRHGEICCLQVIGQLILTHEQVQRCVYVASCRVEEITKLVHEALERDAKNRAAGTALGFAAVQDRPTAQTKKNDSPTVPKDAVDSSGANERGLDSVQDKRTVADEGPAARFSDLEVHVLQQGVVGVGGPTSWEPVAISSSSSSDEDELTDSRKSRGRPPKSTPGASGGVIGVSSDSEEEEEEVVTLTQEQFNRNVNRKK